MSNSDENIVLEQWVCTCCGYVYEPEVGDPDHGVPAGTPFDKIPETWMCPLCMALKNAFERA